MSKQDGVDCRLPWLPRCLTPGSLWVPKVGFFSTAFSPR